MKKAQAQLISRKQTKTLSATSFGGDSMQAELCSAENTRTSIGKVLHFQIFPHEEVEQQNNFAGKGKRRNVVSPSEDRRQEQAR